MYALFYDRMDEWFHVRKNAWIRGCIVARTIDGQRSTIACFFACMRFRMDIETQCKFIGVVIYSRLVNSVDD